MSKIRITEEFLQDICYCGYNHGEPVDNIQVYTTLGCCFNEPVVKIILPRTRGGICPHASYMAAHFTVRCPKKIMFKGFTLKEFCKRFYAVQDSKGTTSFKFYK